MALDTATDDLETENTLSQFVTFFLGKECFAFPMSSVLEIIRAPEAVPVPLTSAGLVGLANLRGEILPVVDLRKTLGLETRTFDDTTRAVVVSCGRPVALMVDRVSSVLDADPATIEPAEQGNSVADMDLLTGVIKGADGSELVQIIDVEGTVAHEFASITAPDKTRSETAIATKSNDVIAEVDDGEDGEDGTAQFVSLLVKDQEYAFAIQQVDEIVRVPELITEVPKAAHHVLGLMNLRGRLLPLVSLRGIFGLPEDALTEHHRIVVVRIPSPDRMTEERVGVVVDHVREVLRVTEEECGPMPSMLREDGAEEIETICQLEEGQRLVAVLSLASLFDHPALLEAREMNSGEEPLEPGEEDEMLEDDDDDDTTIENQLVIYQLNGQEFGVPISFVQEIIRVPEELTEVPKTADYVEGMINLRGAVLPVANMRKRFDLDAGNRNDRQRILVLSVEGQQTGFVVDSVTEVLRLPSDTMEASPALSEEQSRLIGRVAKLDQGQRIVQILDAEQLMGNGPSTDDVAA